MISLDQAQGFDFHSHVDLDKDPARLMAECFRKRILTVAVTTTPKAWPKNKLWARDNPYVIPALGLHPELVSERPTDLPIFEKYAGEAQFFGEVGLDGSARFKASLSAQKIVFEMVLTTAQDLGRRVVTIHSRSAVNDVIAAIEKHTTPDRVVCILHWFSGNWSAAERAAATGCYFSINGQMLSNESGRMLVRSLPADRLLTETDSPFSSTSERPSLPWDVMETVGKVARIRDISATEMANTMFKNSRQALRFLKA
jgi:TatD DNase family protein